MVIALEGRYGGIESRNVETALEDNKNLKLISAVLLKTGQDIQIIINPRAENQLNKKWIEVLKGKDLFQNKKILSIITTIKPKLDKVTEGLQNVTVLAIIVIIELGLLVTFALQGLGTLPTIYVAFLIAIIVTSTTYVNRVWNGKKVNKMIELVLGVTIAILLAQTQGIPIISPVLSYQFTPNRGIYDNINKTYTQDGLVTLNIKPAAIYLPYLDSACAPLRLSDYNITYFNQKGSLLVHLRDLNNYGVKGLLVCPITTSWSISSLTKSAEATNIQYEPIRITNCIYSAENSEKTLILKGKRINPHEYPVILITTYTLNSSGLTDNICTESKINQKVIQSFLRENNCYSAFIEKTEKNGRIEIPAYVNDLGEWGQKLHLKYKTKVAIQESTNIMAESTDNIIIKIVEESQKFCKN